jgi:sugar/nucleoside kinase (ribokinase family)
MKQYDVLVYGPVFCDLIFTGLESFPVIGQEVYSKELTLTVGGSAIVAHGLHRLGVRVGLITDVGNDPISSVIWEILDQLQLDRELIRQRNQPLKKLTVALSYPDDRAFVSYVDPLEPSQPVTSLFKETTAQHLHLCSLLALKENPNIIQQAHAAGMTVSLDPGWVESALTQPEFLRKLRDLDIFFPSESEVCEIAGNDAPEVAAKTVYSQMNQGALIVKQGAKGALGFSDNVPQGRHVPALQVDAVETTGAGDSFDAGFLYARLENQPLETCMKVGVICGALSTTRIGGITGFPNKKEIERWLKKLPS